jgi:type I restriction enzyme S subunit
MWQTVKLSDVCTLRNGRAYKKPELLSEGKYPVLRVGNFFTSDKWYYSDLELDEKKYCDNGDLLYAWSASFGARIWEGGKVIYHYHIWRVDVDESRIAKKFLFYWFEYDKELIKAAHGTGTTMMHVSKSSMEKRDLSLPPLAEQERIVATLDAAFSEIDNALSLAEKNVANSKRLYAYAIDKAFKEHKSKAERLGQHSDINYGYTAKASFDKGSYKFLRITDIQNNNVDWKTVPYCDVEPKKLAKMLLHDGDIVFARTGATTGKNFLVQNPIDAVFASYLIRVSVNRSTLLPRYVLHYFQSAEYWQQVNDGISGAAQGGFNATKLAELHIPIIDKIQQKDIVHRLDNIENQSRQLSMLFEQKKNNYAALKSAILTQELQLSEAA